MRTLARLMFVMMLLAFTFAGRARAGYDPMLLAKEKPEQKELVVKDEKRSRDLPIRVYLPAGKAPAPVILFSHGLGGTRATNEYLADHWAQRGYVAVFLQHPGSDDSLWKDKPMAVRLLAMQQAVVGKDLLENFELRAQDVHVVIDQLERWNTSAGNDLSGRMDLAHIGMSGHSFGAATAQAVSGETFTLAKSFTDPRIKAAVMMSPNAPRVGTPEKAFSDVKIPWMLMTGTKDDAPKILGLNVDAKTRLVVFPALPPGGKYELVLNNAEHSAFGEHEIPGEVDKHNPNHHRAILALTTAFWDAYLRQDADAKAWLDSEAVGTVLEKEDHWQKK